MAVLPNKLQLVWPPPQGLWRVVSKRATGDVAGKQTEVVGGDEDSR